VLHGAYTWWVPTSRPRHTITETPRVQEALDDLRATLRTGDRIDFAELLTIGARTKTKHLRADDAAPRDARIRLADQIRARTLPVDIDAADTVKRLGLTPDDDA
jgi:hypothetical protein